MACQRSREIDLPAFLAAPRGEAFADFRLHYPRCAECAAEVRAWTELHEALATSHPEPERLVRYEALPAQERAVVDRHVAGCPSCREELAQLADFDPARLAQPATEPQPARALGGGLREWLAGLGRIFWHPAFAYALVLLMLVPVVQQLAREDADRSLAEQLFAEVPSGSGEYLAVVPEPAQPAREEPPASAPALRPEGLAFDAREAVAAKQRAAQPRTSEVALERRLAPAKGEVAKAARKAGGQRQDREERQEKKDAPAAGLVARDALETPTPTPALAPRVPDAKYALRERETLEQEVRALDLVVANASAPQEADADEALEVPEEIAEAAAAAATVAFAAADESTGLGAGFKMESMELATGRARSALVPQAVAPAPRDLIRLEAWRTPRASPPDDVAQIRLSVPVPAELSPGPGQVRVRDADGRRELRERVDVPAAGAAERRVTVRVPRGWLDPGSYRVELEGAGAPPAAFAFEIE